MAQVIVRNLDDNVVGRLKRLAASEQKSLEQKLREILTEAGRPGPADLQARARALAAKARPTNLDAVDLIREDRER
ncbi:FitA-like ribbon-helix-helix domain-containing protein [Rhodobium gokarnense]|uniref:Plasmid stability protein n=1 Tax=Rhodobium gokarnense TaxID=364296 RepID=A0ABT3HDD4_9HYPH|nr:hypothetical protein [Rhodobium gokarnense]MCW2308390.1 plasmid stability protein [Rhodobium gokarnense]